MDAQAPLVGVIMGSTSDWETMRHASEVLERFGIPHERKVVSAHRTPDLMAEDASSAAARGLEVIIAGAGGAAHLPGMVASHTTLPVIGVPVQSKVVTLLRLYVSIFLLIERRIEILRMVIRDKPLTEPSGQLLLGQKIKSQECLL